MSRKRIYLESYGCPSNKFDSQVMVTKLEEVGHIITGNYEDADIVVVNTCGVKSPTEAKILHRLNFLKNLDKPIVVTGCLSKIDLPAIKKAVPNYLALVDPFSIERIAVAIEGVESTRERGQHIFAEETIVKAELSSVHKGGVIEIVPIAEGCLGACSFCCTRFARGRLFSYPMKTVVDRVKRLVCSGTREIWLTAQDTGAYGLDVGCNLADLLDEVCGIWGNFLVRVGMMNPNNLLGMLDSLIEAYKCEKIFKFLHIPVQSGNDEVLKLMNRFYTVHDFKRIVDSFRRKVPNLSLATDVICGFPGEDEEAFEDTLRLIREIEPDIVNISKFSPRPNTTASHMKQLPSNIVKDRSTKVAALCKSISLKRNKNWLEWRGGVLIDEKGKKDSVMGRNTAYKPIVIKGKCELLGKWAEVQVKEVTTTYLVGEPV